MPVADLLAIRAPARAFALLLRNGGQALAVPLSEAEADGFPACALNRPQGAVIWLAVGMDAEDRASHALHSAVSEARDMRNTGLPDDTHTGALGDVLTTFARSDVAPGALSPDWYLWGAVQGTHGPAPVLFRSFTSDTRHQGDRIWQRYTATRSSGMRFASRSQVA